MTDRFAIVGTAPSWRLTPWDDPGLLIGSLNDAYRMKGFVRADVWYDLHPLHKFYHVDKLEQAVFAHQVPFGHYVRPSDHKAWLASQQIPVFLNPDYLTQEPAAVAWPTAQAFPLDAVRAHFGRYFMSSPALMMAHQVMLGAKEIHIYGIHLATESEYINQRPNFEFLIGRVLGRGKVTETVKGGLRRYETQDGMVVLPEASPVLSSDFQYALEPDPSRLHDPLKWELHKIAIKRQRTVQQLIAGPWWQRKAPLRSTLTYLDAWDADVREQLGRLQLEREQAHG